MKLFGKGINDTACYGDATALSTFKKWYAENNVNDWELDKDLLIPGNMYIRAEMAKLL